MDISQGFVTTLLSTSMATIGEPIPKLLKDSFLIVEDIQLVSGKCDNVAHPGLVFSLYITPWASKRDSLTYCGQCSPRSTLSAKVIFLSVPFPHRSIKKRSVKTIF